MADMPIQLNLQDTHNTTGHDHEELADAIHDVVTTGDEPRALNYQKLSKYVQSRGLQTPPSRPAAFLTTRGAKCGQSIGIVC
jgi:hypothetical protein